MKAKKMGLVSAIVLASVCFLTISTWAVSAEYICTVDQAGEEYGAIIIYLTDTAATPYFTNKCFQAPSGVANEILATALTAQSTGMAVKIYANPDGPAICPSILMFKLVPAP